MLNSKRLLFAVTTSFYLMSALIATTAQASLITTSPATIVSVSVDGDKNSTGAVVTGNALKNNDVIVRERAKLSEKSLRIATFLDFDLSYLTANNVNAPTFSAFFEIDFVSRLNTKNNLSVLLGQVESAWSDESGSLPLYEWASSSTNQTAVVGNVKKNAFDTYTVDVTSTIQNWVNGVSDNYGFVLFASATKFQGAGLDNASLVVNVPEPSTIAIFGLALVGLSLSRKAKKQS